jgi:sugar phosphate isomerase/epimerase
LEAKVTADTAAETTTWAPGDWPIAAAMLQFPSTLPDGTSTQDQPAEGWVTSLEEVVDAGFDCLDPTDSWLRVADLSGSRRAEFRDAVHSVGLRVPVVSSARRSVVHAAHGIDNLTYLHRMIDAAAELGATTVCTGFFQELHPAQQAALWFWTAPGHVDDPGLRETALDRTRELGRHAAEVGLNLSLEMYEDTYLGTADDAVSFVHDVGLANVGLNPDLGNIVRLHRPVERWESMAAKVLPLANFWHVKNYLRTEDATTGLIVTAPAPLELGVMNYRQMVRLAIDAGFRGPFTTEHYGGDGLSVSATNRDYMRRILPRSVTVPASVNSSRP